MTRRLARLTAHRSVLPIVPMVLAVVAVACGGGAGDAGTDNEAGALITVDGSSTVYPITEAVAEEFAVAAPGSRVTVGIAGTGGGFSRFCAGEIDISDASRPITATERETCASAGIEYIELPVAYDGLSVVVNPANTWVDLMTVAELKRLWEPAAQGTILRWNQIRPDWPDREIHLFGAGVDSGTFDYFTQVIVGEEGASRGDFTSSEDDNVLVQGVEGDELALGFFGYAYYEENRDRLKIVPIDGGAGPVAPSPETVRSGEYAPLSRPVFIYVNVASLARPEVEAFVDFYLTEGSPLVREVGYVALNDVELPLVRQRFAERVTGSMYENAAPGVRLESLLSASQ